MSPSVSSSSMSSNHSSWPTPALTLVARHLTNDRHSLLSFALTTHAFNDAARPLIFKQLTKWVTMENVEMMVGLRGSAVTSVRSLRLLSHPKSYSLQLETQLTSSILSLLPRFPSLAHVSVHQLISFGTRFAAFPPPSPVAWSVQRLDVGVHQDNLHVLEWMAQMDSLDRVTLWMGRWTSKNRIILERYITVGSSVPNKRQLEVEIRISSYSLYSLGDGIGRLLERFLRRITALTVYIDGSEWLKDGISSLLLSLRGQSNLQVVHLTIAQDETPRSDVQEPDHQEDLEHPGYDINSSASLIDQLSRLLFHPSAAGSYRSLRRLEVLYVDISVLAIESVIDNAEPSPEVVHHVVVEFADGSRLGDGTARVVKDGVIEDAIMIRDGTVAERRRLGW